MTDLEIVKKCAEKMGLDVMCWENESSVGGFYCKLNRYDYYDPLHDDAQAMALVKRFRLNIGQLSGGWVKVFTAPSVTGIYDANGNDLNRAICECVAKIGD